MTKIRIGTRGSPLARAQAFETRRRLMAAHGLEEQNFEIVIISTTGDRITDRPLADIGGKGLFTKEIEEALLGGSIDLAVHSMKDMPAELPQGLDFAAVLEREDPRDAFLSARAMSLRDLPKGGLLGSSSVRRTAQAMKIRPDLQAVQFRGNVDTRLRKLSEGVADATFLACAGLNRLGLSQHITSIVPMEDMLPAVAQGAVAIEIATGNHAMRDLLAAINHQASWIAVACERAFLKELDGSCRTPIAGHAILRNGDIDFRGESLTLDGSRVFEAALQGPTEDAVEIGREAGVIVKEKGGQFLVQA